MITQAFPILSRGKKTTHNLVEMQAQLAVILEAALLQRELGIDGSYVAKRIKEASRFRRIAIRAGQTLWGLTSGGIGEA